jgi:hypothetical protein
MVQPGDNIIIDSGTTTISLARHLREAQNVTVMTNGLNIAWELADAPGVDLILTGGLLRKQSLSIRAARPKPACRPTASTSCSSAWMVSTCSSASPPTTRPKPA